MLFSLHVYEYWKNNEFHVHVSPSEVAQVANAVGV